MIAGDLIELMEEPPGGANHGRTRNLYGGWTVLETAADDAPSIKRYVEEPAKHGTRYAYRKRGCRCVSCRAWQARRMRRLRQQRTDISYPEAA